MDASLKHASHVNIRIAVLLGLLLSVLFAQFASAQQVITTFSAGAPGDPFNGPKYLAFDKAGNLFVSDSGNHRVLKDSAGQPVFPLTRNANGDFELLTLPVRICPSVPAIGTGAKSVFLGDLSYLVMRRVKNSLSVKRVDELYANNAEAGFCSFLRISSGFAKPSASDSPVKFLQHS